MRKFWRNASLRLKFGLICTLFFLILGFVVFLIPHTDPFPNAIMEKNLPPRIPGIEKLGIFDGTENGVMKYKGATADTYHYLGTTSQGQDIFWLLWPYKYNHTEQCNIDRGLCLLWLQWSYKYNYTEQCNIDRIPCFLWLQWPYKYSYTEQCYLDMGLCLL